MEKIASLLFGSEELCPLCGVEERSSTERCCTVCEGKLEFVEGFWDDEKLQCHYFFFYRHAICPFQIKLLPLVVFLFINNPKQKNIIEDISNNIFISSCSFLFLTF